MTNIFSKTYNYFKAHPKVDLFFLAAAITSFVTIALFNINRAAIWFDEAFSYYIIQFSFIDIVKYTASDVHPPLYYWTLKIWTGLFGSGELGMRSMSVFFAVATIVTMYFLARRLFGRKIALISVLFLSVSPMLIRYADEARMYTMAAFFVFSATYALVNATQASKDSRRRWWIVYGILVGLGMWTHYFTAFAWLAHWAWRAWLTYAKNISLKTWWKQFFTKQWVLAYVIAVAVYIPWLYFMIKQLGVVQATGFWIGPVSVDTPSNYLTNIFYYLEHGQVQSWFAVALILIVIMVVVLIPKIYKSFTAREKSNFVLITSLAWTPVILLFILSLPPLRSSFVERYLIPATIGFMVFMAVMLVAGTRNWRPFFRAVPIVLIVGMMIFGITNVYRYGNFNKNTNYHIVTRDVIEEIKKNSQPGQPIIATTPWNFYEAVPYSTPEHPVYFIDASTQYIYGSLDMLKDNDMHKIKDIDAFAQQHPVVWYLGQADSGDIAPYDTSWTRMNTVSYYDSLTNQSNYRATQYRISAE
jgi:mannosyltransferase